MFNYLLAYLDESGKLHDKEFVSFAGYATGPDHWDDFSREWRFAFNRTGVRSVRMQDAVDFRGQFAGWRDHRHTQRDALLLRLAETIESFELASVFLPISLVEFKDLSENDQKHWKSLSRCGFVGVIKCLLTLFPSTVAFHMIYDLSEDYSAKCVRLFNLLRVRDQDIRRRCWAITFADDERTPPLQAADMLAYCSRAARAGFVGYDSIVAQVTEVLMRRVHITEWFEFKGGGARLGYVRNVSGFDVQ